MNPSSTHELVRTKYGEIARGQSCCCSSSEASFAASSCCQVGESYAAVEGYMPDADLGLGCGLPTAHAGLLPGMTVLDLGSGAGNDVFIARREVGPSGRVIGVDFTPDMLALAHANLARSGFTNVEFRQGEIENLPVESASIDVVISNCVLNLVPDKRRAFAEIFRVLRPGGHFCVSDIVLTGSLPPALLEAAMLYVGCVAGALQREDYLGIIRATGFAAPEIPQTRLIQLPDEALRPYLSQEEIDAFRASGVQVLSLTVRAVKPA